MYIGRYIDDLVGVWTGQRESIQDLFKDTIDEHIKFPYVIGDNKLEALGLELSIKTSILEPQVKRVSTKIYRKPKDGYLFVHWSSAHTENLKRSIPYAQLLRLKRNCTQKGDYEEAAWPLL